VVGFLNSGSPGVFGHFASAFRQGLGEAGYVAHRNVGIEYRWAEGQVDRCRRLARELVRAQVAVICAGGPPSALTATDRSQLANASYCAHSRSVTSLTAVRESKERPSLPSSQRG